MGLIRAALRLFTFLIFVVKTSSFLYAGDFDRFFFLESGLRVDPSHSDIADKTVLSFQAKVQNSCQDITNSICISWNVVLDDDSHEETYVSRIRSALQAWSGNADLRLKFDYREKLPDNPASLGLDTFGNDSMAGNFIISFKPTADITFGEKEISHTKLYIVPDFSQHSAEIKWAGIYFNPKLQPGKDFDLKTALLHEIGRSLGLAPSGVSSSVMFPQKIPDIPRSALSVDDFFWAASSYSSDTYLHEKAGALSGEVLNGTDGSPWVGAHIQVLLAANANVFSQSLDRNLLLAGAFSRENGKFRFPSLPPGNYLLLVEPDTKMPADLSLLDAWLKKFSNPGTFEAEFYDGAGRESNHEPLLSFSPQAIPLAATVSVIAGKETTGVTFVTNVADPKLPTIAAKGSSSESLAKVVAPGEDTAKTNAAKAANAAPPADDGATSKTGCAIHAQDSNGSTSLLGLFFVLGLLVLIRRDQKAKWYLAECQKRERYSR